MSDFWLGVFVGLATWWCFQVVLTALLLGRETVINKGTLIIQFVLMVIAMFGAWWVAIGL